jgi:hypothetical protein
MLAAGGRAGTSSSGAGGLLPTCFGSGGGPAPVCPADQCGNGVRDQCTLAATADCPARTSVEVCDGEDLGSETCASRGFVGGTLACSSACTFDIAGCNQCLPIGDGVTSCGAVDIGASDLQETAIAATDTEIAVAWTDGDSATRRLSFTRLSPSFAVISTSVLADAQPTGGIAVVALPSGWAVAAGYDEGLFLFAIDADGHKVARTLVAESGPEGPYGVDTAAMGAQFEPVFAAGAAGGPLLFWQTGYSRVRASAVAADALSTSAPVELTDADHVLQGPSVTAAFVQGAFSVVYRLTTTDGLRLVRVATDAHVISSSQILPTTTAGAAALVADSANLRLIYDTASASAPQPYEKLAFQRLSPTGVPSGSPTAFAKLYDYIPVFTRALVAGEDTLALLTGDHTRQLALARLGADGHVVGAIREIIHAPDFGFPHLVRRGPDIVVGWIRTSGRGSLGLARISP